MSTLTLHPSPEPGATTRTKAERPTHTGAGPDTPRDFVEPQTIYIQSVIVMTMVFIVGIALPTWIAMGDAEFAIGLALFSAFWGGPGFGVMAGAARVATQEARLGLDH